MYVIDKKCISSVTLFTLELSEGELMVYESCVDYVLRNCPEKLVSQLTGCENKHELAYYKEDLIRVIKTVDRTEYFPDKYNEP